MFTATSRTPETLHASETSGSVWLRSTKRKTSPAIINAIDLDPSFYEDTDKWHVTLGDSDQDR